MTPDRARLEALFEGAPRFLDRLAVAAPFEDDAAMFATARTIAHAMPEAEQLELIDAHPRLGAPPASVSALSFVEQGYDRAMADHAAGAGEDQGTPGPGTPGPDTPGPDAADPGTSDRDRLAAELDRLNAAYEGRFGFRYCVFVAGRSREALIPGMEAALRADRNDEITRALDAVVDIAADRHAKLSSGTAAPPPRIRSGSGQGPPT